jgi:magnesium chelatase subunit D
MSPFDPAWADEKPPAYTDEVSAAALTAIDPGLGGILVRSWSSPARDSYLHNLRSLFPDNTPHKKLPLNISEDRLAGGLDLPATLAAGRPIMSPGILAEAAGGILILAMSERITASTAARIALAADSVTLIALDEGIEDEATPTTLTDRLAFTVAALPGSEAEWPSEDTIKAARRRLPTVQAGEQAATQIIALAARFGIPSLRACLFAHRAARAAAAWRGAASIEEPDIALAARLVLLPRATQFPAPEQEPEPPPPPPEDEAPEPPKDEQDSQEQNALEDKTDEAESATLPPGLLAALIAAGPRRTARSTGQSGATASLKRGRPTGTRPGTLNGDARLHILDTIRAAAPWQRLRKTQMNDNRLAIRASDFRIRKFKEQPRRIAIFAVDASGSSALNRLAQAKGAIQLLLAECYVNRDEVALIAFRGKTAETLLPPTGALARVRRALADLPGGGPTPLSHGIAAAAAMATAERRKGHDPYIVLLTDGGANIGATGTPGRAAAAADALSAAKSNIGIPTLVVDTSPRKNPFVRDLAAALHAKYLPLPYADSAALSRAVQNFSTGTGAGNGLANFAA